MEYEQHAPTRSHDVQETAQKQSALLPMRTPLQNNRRPNRILPSSKKRERHTTHSKLRQSLLCMRRPHNQKTSCSFSSRRTSHVNDSVITG